VPGGCEQIDRVEPKLQRRAAILKRSANSRVDMMTAPLTREGPFSFDAIPLRRTLTLWADVFLAKANFKQVLKAGFIIRELSKKLPYRYTVLVAIVFHATRMPKSSPYV